MFRPALSRQARKAAASTGLFGKRRRQLSHGCKYTYIMYIYIYIYYTYIERFPPTEKHGGAKRRLWKDYFALEKRGFVALPC